MDRMDTASQRLDKALRRREGALDSLIERAREPLVSKMRWQASKMRCLVS